MIVVCDTSPVNYLVLIGEIDLLPQLFTTVVARDRWLIVTGTLGVLALAADSGAGGSSPGQEMEKKALWPTALRLDETGHQEP